MPEWTVRVTAVIEDDMTVELPAGSADEEIIAAAHADWRFVEAGQWTDEITDRPSSCEDLCLEECQGMCGV